MSGSNFTCKLNTSYHYVQQCKAANQGRCKRMGEGFINSCKTALNNLMSSEKIKSSADPYDDFFIAIKNFHAHYCLDDHTSTWCHHEKVRKKINSCCDNLINPKGADYKSKHAFTCKIQADSFQELLEEMATRPQDYVSSRGRLTTNSVEGFHGLALLYRDKRTDLQHTHGHLPQGNYSDIPLHNHNLLLANNYTLQCYITYLTEPGPLVEDCCLWHVGCGLSCSQFGVHSEGTERVGSNSTKRSTQENLYKR